MKKMLKVLLCMVFISMVFGVSNVFASREHPEVFIDNKKLDIYANVTSLGTTLVPMRPIFEAYAMRVDWDNNTKTVTATKNDTTIKLTNNSYEAYLNGEKVTLNQAPSLEPTSNIFYVNLRFISEALGADVTWSKTTDDASIHINFSE
ncbi:copper amine oxidase N-terminal domain-containing protein [Paenibacillus zanthoxyli]|uniref:copper amine oxidase N-terminal domain-containing protein n=1 Tax=Paenibacillus zanthoxyli TaxID=369399 RepID=UPI000470BCA1|nr:copper amine oxidase N-terminal domain-containing protein [Paenibacillus zanthoxyli]